VRHHESVRSQQACHWRLLRLLPAGARPNLEVLIGHPTRGSAVRSGRRGQGAASAPCWECLGLDSTAISPSPLGYRPARQEGNLEDASGFVGTAL
jgi:hypothetical protein